MIYCISNSKTTKIQKNKINITSGVPIKLKKKNNKDKENAIEEHKEFNYGNYRLKR